MKPEDVEKAIEKLEDKTLENYYKLDALINKVDIMNRRIEKIWKVIFEIQKEVYGFAKKDQDSK